MKFFCDMCGKYTLFTSNIDTLDVPKEEQPVIYPHGGARLVSRVCGDCKRRVKSALDDAKRRGVSISNVVIS